MTTAVELFAAFAVQMFIIVDPVGAVPIFLAITPDTFPADRRRMAGRGCLVAFAVVTFFLLAGPWLLGHFGIGLAAVQVGGGILLFIIALEMLYGRRTRTETSLREERLAGQKEDVSVTPLAVPLLAGPGAIATTLLFAGRADGPVDYLALLLAGGMIFFGSYLLLRRADGLQRWVGTLGMAILTRILGLVLAFIAVQYVLDGAREVFVTGSLR